MSYRTGVGRGENPWNRGGFHRGSNNLNGQLNQSDARRNAEDKFRIAREKQQASVQKHLQQEYESSSEEEELESEPIFKSVLKDYTQLSGTQDGLEKITQFLENSFQSGAGICLICIAGIKRIDPIWNCLECYGYFHLTCIQQWSKDSIFQQKQAEEDLPEFRRTYKINWGCPKCRHEYNQSDIPEKYFCFCKKVQDPVNQPFMVPHSCGEKCDKLLKPECGHSCLLLCHPGPCPPCPKMVQTSCHCKKQAPRTKRCSDKYWSCGSTCGRPLLCKKHRCDQFCHSGECLPCNRESVQSCECGLQKRKQPCMTPVWQCETVCDKPFSCGFHKCTVRCHSGSCGECPKTLERSCPCGKTVAQLPCTEEIPTCNETCEKPLDCGVHFCSQKCHKGSCGMCLEIVKKVCRCGLHKKELPCQKEFLCETKCKRMKNCTRHPCNRKCCDNICPPCEKPCGRTLSCGNHKCPGVCHRGSCYPCPQTVQVKCRCGGTSISVACGRERKTKPPKCSKLCQVPPKCHHSTREPHQCHFGECPPCGQICGKARKSCSHKCPVQCHSAVWQIIEENPRPAGPWEVQQQMKRCNLPCPDCVVPVPVTCLGGHETLDYPCYKAEPTSCKRPCGRLLSCGNHLCKKACHTVVGAGDSLHAGENCSDCDSKCDKPRPLGCTHRCPRPCHPGDCPPCSSKLKTKCHCTVSFLFIECCEFHAADDVTKERLLSCGNFCHKNYPCGHRCRANCHSGECPEPEQCKQKVKLTCKCNKIVKKIPCNQLKNGQTLIECTELCSRLEQEKKEKESEFKSSDAGVEKEMKRKNYENLGGSSGDALTEKVSNISFWTVFGGAVLAIMVFFMYSSVLSLN